MTTSSERLRSVPIQRGGLFENWRGQQTALRYLVRSLVLVLVWLFIVTTMAVAG